MGDKHGKAMSISSQVVLSVFTNIHIFFISVSLVSAGSLTYTYDNLHRLIMAEFSDGSVIEFTYDAAGNRITKEVMPGNTCEGDFGKDGDVDGSDLAINSLTVPRLTIRMNLS